MKTLECIVIDMFGKAPAIVDSDWTNLFRDDELFVSANSYLIFKHKNCNDDLAYKIPKPQVLNPDSLDTNVYKLSQKIM